MDQTTEQTAQPDEQATTTTLSSDQPQEQTVDFQSLIPAEYKNEKALQNFQDMDGFVKSFLHSQKLVGTEKINIPNKFATDSDWNDVYKKLGRPENSDGYKYNLPKESKLNEDSLKAFSVTAHQLGLLPKQAEGIINYYNEIANASEIDTSAKAETSRADAEKTLRKEYGSAYKNRINAAKHLASSTLGNDFLNNTILQDGSKLGDNPIIVKAFAELASKISEDTMVKGEAPSYMSVKEINTQIAALQQPGSAYLDKQHPNHDAAVIEMQTLIQKKNNEEVVE